MNYMILSNVREFCEENWSKHTLSQGNFDSATDELVWKYEFQNENFMLKVSFHHEALMFSVSGETSEGRRYLRNALIGRYRMSNQGSEHHVLAMQGRRTTAKLVYKAFTGWYDFLVSETPNVPSSLNQEQSLSSNQIAVHWWDKQSNFGDAVGPWLIQRMTGLYPVNVRERPSDSPPIISVGSILAEVRVPGTKVWGTGLMRPLEPGQVETLKAIDNVKVMAVRGKRTQEELTKKLGWHVPDVYGDPALLLPRYHPRATTGPSKDMVAVVPHYVHSKFLNKQLPNDIHVVDVQNGLETVADQISASKICISSSLHGLILAQAYGVPWVWLRVIDKPLGGDKFKFDDFFSTIDGDSAAIFEVSSDQLGEANFAEIGLKAKLPELQISLDALQQSIPTTIMLPKINKNKISKNDMISYINKIRINKFPRKVFVTNQETQKPIINISPTPVVVESVPADPDREVHKLLRELLSEVRTQRKLLETLRVVSTSPIITSVRESIYGRQMTMEETLDRLATSSQSFARFGDGEFRLLVHPEENLRFQNNSIELRKRLQQVLDQSAENNLLIGFPLIYSDNSWTKIWQDLWPLLENLIPKNAHFANSHVTRPVAFSQLKTVAIKKWNKI